jgi:hypothetical protein
MDTNSTGFYSTVYDGFNYPNILTYTVGNLQRGLDYSFKLEALNVNGPGPISNAEDVTLCTIPGDISPPQVIASTKISLTLEWEPPLNDGGCPITSYELTKDDGSGPAAAIDTIVDPLEFVGGSYTQHTVDFLSGETSSSFKFQIAAYNKIGKTISAAVTYVLAAVPDAPETGPTCDKTETTLSQIKVLFPSLDVADNGGSDILSYELQMLDTNDIWISLIGGDPYSLDNQFIVTNLIQQPDALSNTWKFR